MSKFIKNSPNVLIDCCLVISMSNLFKIVKKKTDNVVIGTRLY